MTVPMATFDTHHLPSGSLRTSRRDSSSSHSSEAYSPLPPGRYFSNVHGNCSRCHHHHSSARIKVNVPRDSNTTTHIRCQGCREKWLAVGGRNQTRLSSLSINSTIPDPVTVRVQHSLANMVRSTTAIAALSPVLAGIAELPPIPTSPFSPFFGGVSIDSIQRDGPSRSQPMEGTNSSQPRDIVVEQAHVPAPPSMTISVQPCHSQKYGIHTGRHFANLKENLAKRFPALHRANLSRRISIMRQHGMSAKRTGKQPVNFDRTDINPMTVSHASAAAAQEEYGQKEPSQGQSVPLLDSILRPSLSSTMADQFLTTSNHELRNIGALTQEEKGRWMRARFTEFKQQSTYGRAPNATVSMRTSMDLDLVAANQVYEEVNLRQGLPHHLLGLGSHHGEFDTFLLDRPYTAQATSISISPRTSEAETFVDDTITVASGPRYSWPELVRRERSRSPRSLNVNVRTRQHIRRSNELRD